MICAWFRDPTFIRVRRAESAICLGARTAIVDHWPLDYAE